MHEGIQKYTTVGLGQAPQVGPTTKSSTTSNAPKIPWISRYYPTNLEPFAVPGPMKIRFYPHKPAFGRRSSESCGRAGLQNVEFERIQADRLHGGSHDDRQWRTRHDFEKLLEIGIR